MQQFHNCQFFKDIGNTYFAYVPIIGRYSNEQYNFFKQTCLDRKSNIYVTKNPGKP